jgi:hypothetical protein
MTMHLEGPWLSTTGKRKGKQKFRNAESAARARELSASWDKLKKDWGAVEQETRRNRALKAPAMTSYSLSYPPGREPKQSIPSVDTGVSVAARPADKVYTGTAMLGVATMHKSNSVPVFSQEDAVEISRMRRG